MNEHQYRHHGAPYYYGLNSDQPVHLQGNEHRPVSYNSRGGIVHQPIPHQGRTGMEYQPVHHQVQQQLPYRMISSYPPPPPYVTFQGRIGTTSEQAQVPYRNIGEHPPLTQYGTNKYQHHVPYGSMSRQQPVPYQQMHYGGNVIELQPVSHSGTNSPVQYFYGSPTGSPPPPYGSRTFSQPPSYGSQTFSQPPSYGTPTYSPPLSCETRDGVRTMSPTFSQPFSSTFEDHYSDNGMFIDLSQATSNSLNNQLLPYGTIMGEHQTIPYSTTTVPQQAPYGLVNHHYPVPYSSMNDRPVLHGTAGDHQLVPHGVLQERHQMAYDSTHYGRQSSIPYGSQTDHQYSPLAHTITDTAPPPPAALAYPYQRQTGGNSFTKEHQHPRDNETATDISTVGIPSIPYSSISEYHDQQAMKNRPVVDQSPPSYQDLGGMREYQEIPQKMRVSNTVMREHHYFSNKVNPPISHPLQHQRVNAIMKEHHVAPQKRRDDKLGEYQYKYDSNINHSLQSNNATSTQDQQDRDQNILNVSQSPTHSKSSNMSDTFYSCPNIRGIRSKSYSGEIAHPFYGGLSEPQPVRNQAKGTCILCKKDGKNLYKGTRYQCHGGTKQHQRDHNKMCYECASVTADFKTCPLHLVDPYFDYEEYPVEPALNSDL